MASKLTQQIVPVHSIPPEVLLSIFLELRNYHFEEKEEEEEEFFGNSEWVQVSHVCQEWRAVALGCPDLWTPILIGKEPHEWAELSLERSRSAPIDARLYLSEDTAVAFVRDVFSAHMWRCTSLKVYSNLSGDTLRNLLSTKPMTQLRLFHLENRAKESIVVDDRLLQAPSLQTLEVTDAFVCWNTSALRGLTHVDIDNNNKLATGQRRLGASFTDVLSGLAEMHAMRYLKIHLADDDNVSAVSAAKVPKARLQCLEYFEMNAAPDNMLGLIQSILLPLSCKIVFESYTGTTSTAFRVFTQICIALSTCRLPPLSPNEERANLLDHTAKQDVVGQQAIVRSATLDFGDSKWPCLKLQGYEDVHGCKNRVDVANKPIIDVLFWRPKYMLPSMPVERIAYPSFFSCVDFSQLSVLRLDGSGLHESWNVRLWLESFGSNEVLHTLYTKEVHPVDLFEALGRAHNGDELSLTSRKPTLLNLKKLVFGCLDKVEDFKRETGSRDGLIAVMCGALAKRKKAGFVLEELQLPETFKSWESKFAKVVTVCSFFEPEF